MLFSIGDIYWDAAYIAYVHNTIEFLRPDSTNIKLTSILVYFFSILKLENFPK